MIKPRWINENGPAPKIEPRFARIEIFETIAIVHLEVQGWSGKLARLTGCVFRPTGAGVAERTAIPKCVATRQDLSPELLNETTGPDTDVIERHPSARAKRRS